jgi:DNA polymerase-3 subunit delta
MTPELFRILDKIFGMDALAFIDKPPDAKKLAPVYVLHGDEDFLKRQVLSVLRKVVFGSEENEFGFSTQPGDKAEFAAVRSELETVPFLSPRRLVVIDAADPFISRFRSALEKYVSKPAESGILVLDVKSWPSNTKLYKMVPSAGSIACNSPKPYQLADWCKKWCSAQYSKDLSQSAARLLVDLVGAEMGVLDQELAKLAVYAGSAAKIDTNDVDQLVGNNREQNTWKIFEAIGGGRAEEALTIMDRLFDQGQEPLAVLGAFSWQLRGLAKAGRLSQQGVPLARATERAGFPPFKRTEVEQQMRHLGRRRLSRLYEWLLEANSGLKGGSQLPDRTILERLVVQLARDKD